MDIGINHAPWMREGICATAGDPDKWDADRLIKAVGIDASGLAAATMCAGCPVWRACGHWARDGAVTGMVCAGVAIPIASATDGKDRVRDARRRLALRLGVTDPDTPPPVTHCTHGHEWTPETTRMTYDSVAGKEYRRCITCARTQDRDRRGRGAA